MGWLIGFFVLMVLKLSSAKSSLCVPTKTLNDGNKIPALALGTWRGTAKQNESIDLVRQAVVWALEAGYRHIDTAYLYGTEPQVGQGIAEAIAAGLIDRDEVFVTTKLWNDSHRRDQVIPALKSQLKSLNLDYVDLYLIHMPISMQRGTYAPLNIDYLETWEGMVEAKKLGLARSIGVSNFNATQVQRLVAKSGVTPAVGQIETNPTRANEELVKVYQSLGMQVMGYSPFGFAVNRINTDGFRPRPQFDDPVIVALAEKYGKTSAQIFLRYLVDRDLIPIPKSTNEDHIYENIDIFDFSLTQDELRSICAFDIKTSVHQKYLDLFKSYPYYPYVKV